MSTSPYYPTDLTEAQWTVLAALLPARKWRAGGRGRPPCDLRQVLNGICYLLKTGCQWRMIPREFGKWNTLYAYFKAFNFDTLASTSSIANAVNSESIRNIAVLVPNSAISVEFDRTVRPFFDLSSRYSSDDFKRISACRRAASL